MNALGLVAEFKNPEDLIRAAHAVRSAGFQNTEAYAPFPVEGLSEAVGMRGDRVALITLIGGLSTGVLGYFMQWYANVIDYPIDVGGRPYHSWPAFVPVTFELTILGAAISAAIGMLLLNRLPRFYHPMFSLPRFHRGSTDAFFLCVLTPLRDDPNEALATVRPAREILQRFDPISIEEINGAFE